MSLFAALGDAADPRRPLLKVRLSAAVTDEASAVEALGHAPKLVRGHAQLVLLLLCALAVIAAWKLRAEHAAN